MNEYLALTYLDKRLVPYGRTNIFKLIDYTVDSIHYIFFLNFRVHPLHLNLKHEPISSLN